MADHVNYVAMAKDPSATREQLARVIADGCVESRQALARRLDCPPDLLRLLAADEHTWVVRIAARHPDLDENAREVALTRLAGGSVGDRVSAAENPHCPPSVLELLSYDLLLDISAMVAQHPNCPRPLRRRLRAELRGYVGVH